MMMARGDAAVVVPNIIMFRLAFFFCLAVAAPTHWRKIEEAFPRGKSIFGTYLPGS